MKTWLLLSLLVIGRSCQAYDWTATDSRDRDIAFISGYLSASLYDIAYSQSPKSKTHQIGYKIGLGVALGAAIAICDANNRGKTLPFEDVVFGGLGGVACFAIHF